MGRKRTGEGSTRPQPAPKKSFRAPGPSSAAAGTAAKGTKDAYPLNLPPSTRGLSFVSDEQKSRYDLLITRNTSEQKYFHADTLRQLGLLDDMLVLFGRLGWTEYVNMQYPSYDRLMVEFLSSVIVNWDHTYNGQEVEIYFRMFNFDHRMSLRMFNDLLRFPVTDGAYRDVPSLFRTDPVWLNITCSNRKQYRDRWGRPRVFDPRQAKATDLCNVNLRYLQRLTANIIFGRNDNQNGCRKAELFIVWCALSGTPIDTGAFIIHHLAEVAKPRNRNVLSVGGTITAIATALGYGSRLSSLEPHFLGGHLDLGTLHHMHIIDTRGTTIRYPHHKQILLTFPDLQRTTISNKRNWNCDQVINRVPVIPTEAQLSAEEALLLAEEGDVDLDEEGEGDDIGIDPPAPEPQSEAPHGEEESIPPPPPPFHPHTSHEAGGSSSSATYMPLDPAFLQSFSTLQVEVSGLREGFTGMRADIGRISGRMDSIEEGVSYFRGFVDRQEEREQRRIQREEERAMREAREYEDHRRMNELLWRQSESIRQMEERLRSFQGDQGSSSSIPSYDPSTFFPFPPHFWPPPGPDGTQ